MLNKRRRFGASVPSNAQKRVSAPPDELKYFDRRATANVVSSTTSAGLDVNTAAAPLFAITQGDSATTRDGRQIAVRDICVRGYIGRTFDGDEADFPPGNFFRVALVLDTQRNALNAALATDLVWATAGSADLCPFAFTAPEYEGRFIVLDEALLVEPQRTGGGDGTNTNSISGFKEPFELHWSGEVLVTYLDTGGGLSSITDNMFFVTACASNTTGTPTVNINARTRFLG